MQIDLAEYESELEIEDLANPKNELNKKIVSVASIMRKWNDETTRLRKTVKEQFVEILDLGLNKYKMEKTELRRLIEEIFRYYSVRESYLRKLLPVELKDSSKTRISSQQKQEIKKESQRLLQERALGSQQESEIRKYGVPNSSTVESASSQPMEPEATQSENGNEEDLDYTSNYHSQDQETPLSSHSDELITVQSELSEAYKKIEKLEADVRRLSEQFVAKANLQGHTKTIPLIANIDPVKKIITRIGFEKGSGI